MDVAYNLYLNKGPSRTNNWILRPFVLLFIAFVLLPFVKVIPTNTDTQPNALLMAGLLLAISFRGQRLPKAIFWLWLLPPIAIIIFAVEALRMSDLIYSARSLYNYLALPVIATAVAVEWRAISRFLFPLMNVINTVYFVVALAQFVGGEQFVGNIVGGGFRVGNYDFVYRGAVGLAPEPTSYATVMFLFLVVYSILGKEQTWWAGLALFQILFFTRSPMVIFFVVVVLGARTLLARQFKTLIVGVLCVLALTVAISTLGFFSGSRVRSLMLQLVNDPARILENDYSVMSRLANSWYGCTGIFHSYGAPNGFTAFADYYNDKIESANWLRPSAKASLIFQPEFRIMSGFGALFFELGLIGLVVPVTLWRLVRRRYGTAFSLNAVSVLLGFGLVAFQSGVPIGFPPLALILGVLAGAGATVNIATVARREPVPQLWDHQTRVTSAGA